MNDARHGRRGRAASAPRGRLLRRLRARTRERDELGARLETEGVSRFRALVEQSADATFLINLDGGIVYASPAAATIFGYAPEEWTARRGLAFEIVLPEQLEDLHQFLANLQRASPTAKGEWGWRHKSGRIVYTESMAALLSGPAGEPVGVQVVARDITERRLAEERLVRQMAREGLIGDAARCFLHEPVESAIDRVLRALQVDLGADRIAVYRVDPDEGLGTFSCVHEACAPGVAPRRDLMQDVPLQSPELGALHVLDGDVIRIDDVSAPAPELAQGARIAAPYGARALLGVPVGTGGRPRGLLTVNDLRGPRAWTDDEVSLVLIIGELIGLALLRRDTESALSEATEAAVAASLSKSRFVANMSHELRTPLNGVIGMVDLLAATELDERQRRYTEVARSSASLLLSVINDVLDFSKIEANRLEITEGELSIAAVLEEVASVLALSAEDKGLDLSCQWSPALAGPLSGDPARIRQILVNLVTNAIKFTPAGEVRMRALVERDEGAVVVARFEVSDTGIGVSAAARRRLFQPFSQGDPSTTRRHGGTGLGLAICQELCARMGGAIGVESAPGQGATFWVTIPLRRVEGPPLPGPSYARLRGVRVLGVDDNATNREILAAELSSVGMLSTTVADGPAALAALAEAVTAGEPFALALVDHHMPGMDGLELCRQIMGDPGLRGVVLVILGSVGRPLSTGELRERGIAGYVTKPIWRARLLQVILAALEGEEAPGPGPASVLRAAARAGAGRRVLVVEDSDINAEVARSVLCAAGYAVDRAIDGKQGVETVLGGAYDVVLMDCQLPELDGFEATRRIRAGEAEAGRVRIPIIALTASVTRDDRERCLASGMDDFVPKPLDAARLLAIVDARISGRPLSAPPVAAAPREPRRPTSIPPAAAALPIADLRQALARVQGNTGLLGRLAGQLRTVARVTLDDLARALAARDESAVRFLAHRFSGQAATFEALQVVAGVEALREAALGGRFDDAERCLVELRQSVALLLDELAARGLG